jgi:hypothetical protein
MRIEVALASLTLAGLISAPVAGADPPCQADPSKGETCSHTVIVLQSPTFPDGRPIDDNKFNILVPAVPGNGGWKANQIPPDALLPQDAPPPAAPPPADIPTPTAPPPAPAEQSCHGRVIPADDFCPPA